MTIQKYGWYEYTDHPPTIINVRSNQRLELLTPDTNQAEVELECIYTDADITAKILIKIQRKTEASPSTKDVSRLIILDYNRIYASPPSYGYWRRIDDFLTDALPCWPALNSWELNVIGGWRHSGWSPQWARKLTGTRTLDLIEKGEYRDDYLSVTKSVRDLTHEFKYFIATPLIQPLDLPAPQRWFYADHEHPEALAALHFKKVGDFDTPFLDRSETPSGFQDKVPYLYREDRQAFVFPSEFEASLFRGEDPQITPYYTYIDEHVFFTFRNHPYYGVELGDSCRDYGYREMPPSDKFRPVSVLGGPIAADRPELFPRLSYSVWKELLFTLSDIWPLWQTQKRIIQISSNVTAALLGNRTEYRQYRWVAGIGNDCRFTGGYLGGLINSYLELRFQPSTKSPD